MVVLGVEPARWADLIESSPDCLFSLESAKNIDHVLSKASTRRHQMILLRAVEPFLNKMIADPAGIFIMTSLVKYGTVATVNTIAGVVMNLSMKAVICQDEPLKACDTRLGILLERILYRKDCCGEHRMELINLLKSVDNSSLTGNLVLLLSVARMIILDKDFAFSICSNAKAQDAFSKLSSTASKKSVVIRFCELLLSSKESEDDELKNMISSFIFNALLKEYTAESSVRPCSRITLLLASCGSVGILRDMLRLFSSWPDISARAKTTEDYAKIISFLLSRTPAVDEGVTLIKAVFRVKKDFDEIFSSRKVSHLQLLAAVAENSVYVAALTKAFGEIVEKKLRGAAVRYRNATKPKAFVTKEALLQRLKNIRFASQEDDDNNSDVKAVKRFRK